MPTLAHLSQSELRALERLAGVLRERFGAGIHGIYLYGSKARGDSHPESDVDVLVVADAAIREAVEEVVTHIECEVMLAGGPYLSTLVFTPERWAWDTPFLLNVREDAIAL